MMHCCCKELRADIERLKIADQEIKKRLAAIDGMREVEGNSGTAKARMEANDAARG